MKNFVKLFGIIAIVAMVGFSMASCGDNNGGNGNGPLQNNDEGQYGYFQWLYIHDEMGGNIGMIIRGYSGPGGALTIPSTIRGAQVIWIEHGVFEDKELTSVIIPPSVTIIEGRAFANNQLASVIIPNSVLVIESDAFADNILTNVEIGDSVESIRQEAFANNQLETIIFPDSVERIGGNAFVDNQLTSITIGADVTLGGFISFLFTTAFGNGFDEAYNATGRQAGTWTRPDTTSTTWTRQ